MSPAAATPAPAAACEDAVADSGPPAVLRMYEEICRGSGELVAAWQAVGFVHGVLNTDNCSLLPWPRAPGGPATGTLDYGPYGFMERFRRDFVPNTSDTGGRYSFENQPHAYRWNCAKLGEALAPLFPADAGAGATKAAPPAWLARGLAAYDAAYTAAYRARMLAKLGLGASADAARTRAAGTPGGAAADALIQGLLDAMEETGADFTDCFRALMGVEVAVPGGGSVDAAADAATADAALPAILATLATPEELARSYSPRVPPAVLSQMLAMAEAGDPRAARQLSALRAEAAEQSAAATAHARSAGEKAADDARVWTAWLRDYARELRADAHAGGGEAGAAAAWSAARRAAMAAANPRYVLRNWLAQRAIERADDGDFGEVAALLARLEDPFGLASDAAALAEDDARFAGPAPQGVSDPRVSCSS